MGYPDENIQRLVVIQMAVQVTTVVLKSSKIFTASSADEYLQQRSRGGCSAHWSLSLGVGKQTQHDCLMVANIAVRASG